MAVPINNFPMFPPVGAYPYQPVKFDTPTPEGVTDQFVPGSFSPLPAADFQMPVYSMPPGWQPPAPSKLGFTRGDISKPGSLVVVDQFIAPMPMLGFGGVGGPSTTPHGHLVSESAKGAGFDGNLIPSEYELKYSSQSFEINNALGQPDLSADEFKRRLDLSINVSAVGLLDTMSERLEGLNEAGLKNSAVNLSYGQSQAALVDNLYSQASMAWKGWSPMADFKKPLMENYARAFDLDATKLMHSDLAVAGPERLKLQQALADQVAGVSESSETIGESRQRYRTAVNELEANHNSVVVSASNNGRTLEYLAYDTGQDPNGLKISSQFHDNILATPETTNVGATDGSGDQEKVAGYSSNFAAVNIYANGNATEPCRQGEQHNAQGTSFAAPKVAAVMAQLHELYPEKSSAEIESMLTEQLSHQLLGYDGNVERPVLNDQASVGMLSRYT